MAVALFSHAAVRRVAGAALVSILPYVPCTYAQIRPVPPIEPPIVRPPIPPIVPPVIPPIATPDARIVTDAGIVAGTVGRASVELPASSAPPAATRTSTSSAPTYRWTILNGRLLSDPSDPVAEFTGTPSGNITLGVSVTADGASYSTSTRITVMPANIAGAISVNSPVEASGASTVTASVPAAVNSDRTFRWSVSGDARIVRGQNTASIAFTPGTPGTKEITCAVTLQNLGTVTLRAYVEVTGTGEPVAVSVDGGSGGGVYRAGSKVTAMADPPAPGTVFDRWVGNVEVLGSDPLAALLPHATFTVPAAPFALTATYKPAAGWTPTAILDANPRSSAGRAATAPPRALYHVPENARGLLVLLHDNGGAAGDWFERADPVLLLRDVVDAGFAVAALASATRSWASQTTLAANPDAQALAALWEKLTRENGLSPTQPVFVGGLGAGAQAAARFAELLKEGDAVPPLAGVVLLCGTGAEELSAVSRVPELFVIAPRDAASGAAGVALARANADLLAGRGVAAQVVETGVRPVASRRFLKLAAIDPAFTATQAGELESALRAADVVDANGYVRQVLSTDAVRAVLPAALQRYGADVAAELQAAAAGRAVPSELAPRILSFLAQRAAAVPAPEPGRITNVSARSRVAYAGDSFRMDLVLSGTERTPILLRAVGPSLARFGIATRCLATRLELYRGNTLVAANEGWDANRTEAAQITAAANAAGAFPLTANSPDAAVLVSLPAGSYQVVIRGVNGTTGDVLAEAFDVTRSAARIERFSTASRIDDALAQSVVAGFVVQGNTPRTVLVRTLGPALAQLGRPADAVMPDPAMTVASAGGARVAANDNWGDTDYLRTVTARAGLSSLAAGSRDAALFTALQPGGYTIEAAAAGGSSAAAEGELMIEIAVVP